MNFRRIALGTLAYTVVTFPIAVAWHVVIFNDLYTGFGYFTGEPSFLVGLLAIVIQGGVLSALYPLVKLKGSPVIRGLKYSGIIGTFFGTSHVLALVAKQTITNAPLFVTMETGYLAVQFGVFGVLVGLVYKGLQSEA